MTHNIFWIKGDEEGGERGQQSREVAAVPDAIQFDNLHEIKLVRSPLAKSNEKKLKELTKDQISVIKNISYNLDGEDTLESEFAKGIRGFLALRFTSPARPYDNLEKQS